MRDKFTTMLKLLVVAAAFTCLAFCFAFAVQQPQTDAETAATPAGAEYAAAALPADVHGRLQAVVEFLASDECEGRRVGTPGCELAAAYLEERLTAACVEPVPGMRGFRQGFSVTRGITVSGEPFVTLYGQPLARFNDFTVAPFSGSGSSSGIPVVFAGYGIVAPELQWDDYAGIDATGKAVVIIRGEPQENDPASAFGGEQLSVYSDLRRKATTARDMGAAALLVVNNPGHHGGEDPLPGLGPTYSAASFDVPVIFIRRELLINSLIGSTGLSWHEIVETMDLEYTPMSCDLSESGFSIELAVEKDLVTGFNLVGVVPGSDPQLASEYVVIGAHYDHLGIGGPESNAPDRYGEIHHGADDNASGVAGVLELAQWARHRQADNRRSLLVCLFSAEEVGLIGSGALLKNPPVPQEQIYCMLNFDMVGRLRDNKLYLGGGGTALEFDSVLEYLPSAHGLELAEDRSGLGGSDHLSFMQQEHPVLFFFTGPHAEYHTPDDTASTVDIAGIERVTGFAGAVLQRLLNRDGALTFNRPPGSAGQRPARKQNLSVTMGTVPSFEDSDEPGYVLGDVVSGGPAELAGMVGGDRIVKIRDRRIADIYDFMFALEDCQPGDVVAVIVVRDGSELEFKVELQARNVQQ